jgi:L-alanine-DL-glutamate epimerase-like enolase superfamily enzyme
MAMRGVVCRINTDTEIYGYGEAAVSYGKGSAAGFHMIKELAPLLIGQDPLKTEWHWKKCLWRRSGSERRADLLLRHERNRYRLMDYQGQSV